jgi:hypothetical protein
MKNPLIVASALACVALATGSAAAQAPSANQQRTYSQADDRDDARGEDDRFALGLGVGVVDPEGAGELYYTANLRIRILDGDDDEVERADGAWRYDQTHEIQAYLEPEIGYWQESSDTIDQSDLSVGINAIGVVPGQVVDYFFGVGAAVHFYDTQIDSTNPQVPSTDESDTHLGGNFQIGLDIQLGDTVSAFGAGRFDLIEGLDDTIQGKVYLGMRFKF